MSETVRVAECECCRERQEKSKNVFKKFISSTPVDGFGYLMEEKSKLEIAFWYEETTHGNDKEMLLKQC